MLFMAGPDVHLTAADLQHLVDLYDDEIFYFDTHFGQLLDGLEWNDLAQDTIVILASDHGEEFMEHRSIKHCHTVFETEIRTPLIVRIPGTTSSGRRDVLADNLDVLPTIVDYLGLDADRYDFDGVSLRSAIEKNQTGKRYSFASQSALRSVTDGRYKLIHDLESETFRLYDLNMDPLERDDLMESGAAAGQTLKQELLRWLREEEGIATDLDVQRAKEDSRRIEMHLRAIGYIE
jgi:arylsulfatase A-like enzyme